MNTDEERRANAEDLMAWVNSYMNVGFTRDEAVAFLVAASSRAMLQLPTTSPDLEELMAKTRRIADHTLDHIDE